MSKVAFLSHKSIGMEFDESESYITLLIDGVGGLKRVYKTKEDYENDYKLHREMLNNNLRDIKEKSEIMENTRKAQFAMQARMTEVATNGK